MPTGEMKLLYLIRHADTRERETEILPPAHDRPLSTVGHHQAGQLAAYLRHAPVDLILASLYRRAQETAAIINQEQNVQAIFERAWLALHDRVVGQLTPLDVRLIEHDEPAQLPERG